MLDIRDSIWGLLLRNVALDGKNLLNQTRHRTLGFRATKDRGAATIEPEATELTARFTKSGTGPTKNSPRLPPGFELAPNDSVRVRYFTSNGTPVGPIRILTQ